MRIYSLPAGLCAAVCLCGLPLYAGQHGHGVQPHANGGPKTSGSPTQAPSTTTTTTTTSPVAQKIASHPQLASRLQPLLPNGTTLDAAAMGFRNQGQFIAALHVSHNLGIPFTSLKSQMVDHHLSLGQAIHQLKPTANSTDEAVKGRSQANSDLKSGTQH
jgi:hypothetical protein